MSEATKEVVDARPERTAPRANFVQADEQAQPLVIDMGKASRKRLRQLKRGRGKLVGKVMGTLDEIREGLGADPEVELLPVVVIYRRKRRWGF